MSTGRSFHCRAVGNALCALLVVAEQLCAHPVVMVAGLSALVSIALAIQGEGLPWQGGRAREGEGLVPEERGGQAR